VTAAADRLYEPILVTGASGFIGSRLVSSLVARGVAVHALVRETSNISALAGAGNKLNVHHGDLLDPRALDRAVRAADPRTVFHLAAPGGHPVTRRDRQELLRVTVQGTANLLESLRTRPMRRFVHVGSSLEYAPADRPLREDDEIAPRTFRGVAKAVATLLVRQFGESTGQPIAIVRPFHVYGPGEPGHRLVPTLLESLCERREIQLSDDDSRRDFVFVDDVVEACVRAATIPAAVGRIFNVGSGRQVTAGDVLAALMKVTRLVPVSAPGRYRRHEWDRTGWEADISSAMSVLDWHPAHTLHDGLARTWAWYAASRGVDVAIAG
jgi:nucleoside-diphosphate-sugar epimerase